MRRPRIGVTCQRHPGLEGFKRGRPLVVMTMDYLDRVLDAGGSPVILPPILEDPAVLDGLEGLLLSGGEDVAPERYGEQPVPELGDVDFMRDAQELPLVLEARARKIPILAICRGLQLINVAMGGSLWQDLPTQRPGPLMHRQTEWVDVPTHKVTFAPGSRLEAYAGVPEMMVNSFHHQGIKDLAPGLVASAWAEDGLIEGFETSDGLVAAVQWHPEYFPEGFTANFFGSFIEACRQPAARFFA